VKPRRNSKRRRLKSPKDSKEPIVFHSPGLKPDVRLTVFKQEFHVHSVILKLHSNSFRKFLDSPQKEAVPASSPFKYDYISVFDDDDITWGLEPLATAAKVRRLSTLPSIYPCIEHSHAFNLGFILPILSLLLTI
jgi:BTB/POZ domain